MIAYRGEDQVYNLPRLFNLLYLECTLYAPYLFYLCGDIECLPIPKEAPDPVKEGDRDDIELKTHPCPLYPMVTEQVRERLHALHLYALQRAFLNGPVIVFLDKEDRFPLLGDA